MLKRFVVIFLCVLLGSLWTTVVMPHTQASAPPVKIYVDPPQIINQALVPTTTFNVSVKVDNIPDNTSGAVGVQFVLTWNSSVLNGVSMEEVFFHSTMPPSELSNLNRVTHKVTSSNVSYAYTYYDVPGAVSGGYAPVSGNHTIANIMLKVVGVGKCGLHLSNTVLGDQAANDIPHQNNDGFFSNAPPPPPALLYVDPPKISSLSLTPGSDFAVNVSIINGSSIYGLEFELGFNASILQANTVTRGSFIPISVTPVTQVDNTSGFVRFNVSLSSSLDGSGDLAQISFHVQAFGGTTLHLYGVQLVDSFGQLLLYTTADGSFDNVLLAKLAIDPPQIIDPTLVPPATFMINVTIADVRGLYGYQFNLTFNPSILICLQLQIQDVLNETHYIPNQNIDNLKGFIFTNVTYYPPAVPLDVNSPTPLVTVKFRVKAIGGTNLTLTDTHLVDSTGQPITHEDHNGYFQSLIVDIGVLAISASPSAIFKGKSTNVTVTVTNEGNSTQSFTLNIYFNTTLMVTMNITSLVANTNATVTVAVNTSTIIWGKYVLSAQVPPLPYETHTADNNLTDGIVNVKVPGDLNGDGVVDILDAILLSIAYGSSPATPNWNPDADLNGDNVVNILDAILLGNYFGRRI